MLKHPNRGSYVSINIRNQNCPKKGASLNGFDKKVTKKLSKKKV